MKRVLASKCNRCANWAWPTLGPLCDDSECVKVLQSRLILSQFEQSSLLHKGSIAGEAEVQQRPAAMKAQAAFLLLVFFCSWHQVKCIELVLVIYANNHCQLLPLCCFLLSHENSRNLNHKCTAVVRSNMYMANILPLFYRRCIIKFCSCVCLTLCGAKPLRSTRPKLSRQTDIWTISYLDRFTVLMSTVPKSFYMTHICTVYSTWYPRVCIRRQVEPMHRNDKSC